MKINGWKINFCFFWSGGRPIFRRVLLLVAGHVGFCLNTDHWERHTLIVCPSLLFVWRLLFPGACGMHLCSKTSLKLHRWSQLYIGDPLHLKTSLCCSQTDTLPKFNMGTWNWQPGIGDPFWKPSFFCFFYVKLLGCTHAFLQGTRLESDHGFLDSAEVGRAFGICQSGANANRWAFRSVLQPDFCWGYHYTPGSN